MPHYWILKSDPDTYSWDDLVANGTDYWDGVRNYQARNNLTAMKKGDKALFYHSITDKAAIGVVEIVKEAYPDPTTSDNRWVAVDVKADFALKKQVTLKEIKANEVLADIALVKQSRLSVIPLSKREFETIVKMGQ